MYSTAKGWSWAKRGFFGCTARLGQLVSTVHLTCSLMLLMPSGPSRLTACFTRSVRPQLSIRKPRSCRNFASVEAASSLLEAQTQSSVLQGQARDLHLQQIPPYFYLRSFHFSFLFFGATGSNSKVRKGEWEIRKITYILIIFCIRVLGPPRHLLVFSCVNESEVDTRTNGEEQHRGRHTAYSHTEAGGAHSPRLAAAAWQSAGHHRCPLRSCVCALCEQRPHAPTPSEAAGPWTACGGR